MGIKIKTEEGAEFSFDTVAEFMEFKKQIDAEEASKETEEPFIEVTPVDEMEIPENGSEIEVGDKVRIVSSDDGTGTPYHYLDVGIVGKVVGKKQFGGIIVKADGRSQCLLPHHYVKLEPLGKDVNGEDLYEGDYVTGSKENEYEYTDDTEVMEVLGYGESPLCEEANIQVKIDGDWTGYNVDSAKFIKLSDNLDEAMAKFNEIKVV